MSARPLLSVVLPTYNEAENIDSLIQAILTAATWPCEILVVDDDSPDGTWRVAERLAQHNPCVRVLHRIGERGLTSAIQSGIDASRGSIVVWLDADFSHPPEVVPRLVEPVLLGRADLAVASRYVPGGRPKAVLKGSRDSRLGIWLSQALNWLASLVLGAGFHDYTSGFIAIRRAAVENIRLRGDYGEYFIDLIVRARRQGYRLLEIPFVNCPRQHGSSKTGATPGDYIRRGARYLTTIARLLVGA